MCEMNQSVRSISILEIGLSFVICALPQFPTSIIYKTHSTLLRPFPQFIAPPVRSASCCFVSGRNPARRSVSSSSRIPLSSVVPRSPCQVEPVPQSPKLGHSSSHSVTVRQLVFCRPAQLGSKPHRIPASPLEYLSQPHWFTICLSALLHWPVSSWMQFNLLNQINQSIKKEKSSVLDNPILSTDCSHISIYL